jgi:hypothetical protein
MIFYKLSIRRFLRRGEAEISFFYQPASLKGGRALGQINLLRPCCNNGFYLRYAI